MKRVIEGLIQLAIAARTVAEHKSILFSTGRDDLLLCFALNITSLQHRDVRLGDQVTHKDISPANTVVVLKNDISLGLEAACWVGLVQWWVS